MKPSNQIVGANHARRANAVMERLTALQNNHRLAIHMVESTDKQFAVDDVTLGHIGTLKPADINSALCAYDETDADTHPSLLSMSLLPAAPSGWSMAPYGVGHASATNYGYLFDLSQTQNHPAKVVRARHKSLCSGNSSTGKSFMLGAEDDIAELKHFHAQYRPHISLDKNGLTTPKEYEEGVSDWKKNLMTAIGGPNGSSLTEQQLNILGNHYDAPEGTALYERYGEKFDAERFGHNIAEFNEILVAASSPHMAAITVPVFNAIEKNSSADLAKHTLQAALVGLEHIDRGIELPVVLYHVSAPHKGALSYVGQSKEELKTVASKALTELRKMGEPKTPSADAIDNNYHDLFNAVEKHLGKGLLPSPRHAWFDRQGYIASTHAMIRKLTPPIVPQR